MSEYASVEDLLADEVTGNTAEVDLPNGKTVIVRAMSRYELQQAGKGTEDGSVVEARMMAACLLKPKLSEAQVTQMQKAKGPKFLGDVMQRIRELSGLDEGADKSGVREVREPS